MARALEGPFAGRASEEESEEEELAFASMGVSRGIISLTSKAGVGLITERDCSSSVRSWIDTMVLSLGCLLSKFVWRRT